MSAEFAPKAAAAGCVVVDNTSHFRNEPDIQLVIPVGKKVRFLLTAGAIGILYKENASISGADVGCQGEVGVACSMAAAASVLPKPRNAPQKPVLV